MIRTSPIPVPSPHTHAPMRLRAGQASTAKLEEPGARGRRQLSHKPALSPHPTSKRPRAPRTRGPAAAAGRAVALTQMGRPPPPAPPRLRAQAAGLGRGPRPRPRSPASSLCRRPHRLSFSGAAAASRPLCTPPIRCNFRAPATGVPLACTRSPPLPHPAQPLRITCFGVLGSSPRQCKSVLGHSHPPPACPSPLLLLPPERESRCQSRCSWRESPAASGSSKYRQAEGERE